MLKKRLIFTLLFDTNNFMLSRNFKLQKVGDLNWLEENYKFSQIAFSIDELIILDVSRETRDLENFCNSIREITRECFVPITAGGGLRSIEDAAMLLKSGADKIVLNTLLYDNPKEVEKIANRFGNQSIVASIDLKQKLTDYKVFIKNGTKEIDLLAQDWIEMISKMSVFVVRFG